MDLPPLVTPFFGALPSITRSPLSCCGSISLPTHILKPKSPKIDTMSGFPTEQNEQTYQQLAGFFADDLRRSGADFHALSVVYRSAVRVESDEDSGPNDESSSADYAVSNADTHNSNRASEVEPFPDFNPDFNPELHPDFDVPLDVATNVDQNVEEANVEVPKPQSRLGRWKRKCFHYFKSHFGRRSIFTSFRNVHRNRNHSKRTRQAQNTGRSIVRN